MVKKILTKVRGFSPVELVIMVGFGALAAAALIYLGTTPHYMASTQPVNVNVKVDGAASVSRTIAAKAQEENDSISLEQVTNSDGLKMWLLITKTGFQESDLAAIGGTVEWNWKETGIVYAGSNSSTFELDAFNLATVTDVMPDFLDPTPEKYSTTEVFDETLGEPTIPTMKYDDAYANNLQWGLYSVGAARPVASTKTESGYTPEWQLYTGEGTSKKLIDGSGVTIAVLDNGMPGTSMQQYQPIPKEIELHPQFDWYDINNPDDGGIFPIFETKSQYEAYYAAHPDPRLPNPANITWQPGTFKAVYNGMVNGKLAVIADWYNGGWESNYWHSAMLNGIVGARHSSVYPNKGMYGEMRGLAPGAKIMNFNHWGYMSLRIRSIYRSIISGADVINMSWSGPMPDETWGWAYGLHKEDPSEPYLRLMELAFQEAYRNNILLAVAVHNGGADIDENHFKRIYNVGGNNTIVTGGVAPRDYDPRSTNLPNYMPYDNSSVNNRKGASMNLDRLAWVPIAYMATDFGNLVELVAPAGSVPAISSLKKYFNLGYSTHGWIDWGNQLEWGLWYVAYRQIWASFALGNSSAVPYTVATAALAIQSYKEAHNGQSPAVSVLKHILLSSADDMVGPETDTYGYSPTGSGYATSYAQGKTDTPGKDRFYGYGRINAKKAIEEAAKL